MVAWAMVVFSIIAPLLGLVSAYLLNERKGGRELLTGYIGLLLGTLVLFEWLPEGLSRTGAPGVFALIAGAFLASRLEERLHRGSAHGTLKTSNGSAEECHTRNHPSHTEFSALHASKIDTVWILGFLGLHQIADGLTIALLSEHGSATEVFGFGLHRFLVGIGVVGVSTVLKRKWVFPVLLLFIALTLIGYQSGELLSSWMKSDFVAWGILFLTGAMVHALIHHFSGPEAAILYRAKSPAALGAGAGLVSALIIGLFFNHQHGAHHGEMSSGFSERCLEYLQASAPAVLVGYVLAGVLILKFPQNTGQWMMRGGGFIQSLKGMLIGLPLPICSCGVVPLYRALIRRGVVGASAIAFLVATPELGLEAFLLSFPLLGGKMTLVRLCCAGVLALFVATICGPMVRAGEAQESEPEKPAKKFNLGNWFQEGFVEIGGDTWPWIMFGIVIAAALPSESLQAYLVALPWGVDVVLACAIGVPVYVCASGATPLVAGLMAAGISPGAGIAFLLSGPATNATTFGVLSDLHGPKLSRRFGALLCVGALLLGLLVNLLYTHSPQSTTLDHTHGQPWWTTMLILCFILHGAYLFYALGVLNLAHKLTRWFRLPLLGVREGSGAAAISTPGHEPPKHGPDSSTCCGGS